ncbi:hypothetical protein ACIA5A_18350 [Micromonospora sp. NPDC051300]|uniref:hypothetical protein n=1 Tax=Micromonospora sp. NPDC051300 TaxID=3364286 RepID=UPI0037B257D3
MTTVVVSVAVLLVLVLTVVAFVSRRDRDRLSSEEDRAAVRHAGADQRRHEAERHLASGLAERHRNPPST